MGIPSLRRDVDVGYKTKPTSEVKVRSGKRTDGLLYPLELLWTNTLGQQNSKELLGIARKSSLWHCFLLNSSIAGSASTRSLYHQFRLVSTKKITQGTFARKPTALLQAALVHFA